MHLVIGAPESLGIGPRYLPASWVVIYHFLPDWADWLWPALFVLTGLVAAVGVRCPYSMRLGFNLSALIFFTWAVAGVYSWSIGSGGNIPGAAANFYIAGCAWTLAHYVSLGERGDAIDEQVTLLGEQVGLTDDASVDG